MVQILCLRPHIEQELPGLELHVCCRNELMYLSEWYDKIFPKSELQYKKSEFAYIKQLTCNMFDHPVEQFLMESGMSIPEISVPTCDLTKKCVIVPEGNAPTNSLTSEQIDRVQELVDNRGFQVGYDIEGAGWVVGVENEQLFLAASRGIPTSLVPTGIGKNIYQKMYPHAEILNL